MKQYFECHITIDPTPLPGTTPGWHRELVRGALLDDHWTFSEIHHDIVLGVGPKFYATKHYNVERHTVESISAHMLALKELWERVHCLTVLRCKIERVLWDERYDVR